MSLSREMRSIFQPVLLAIVALSIATWIIGVPFAGIVAKAQVFSGDVTINADGSVSPANAPITTADNVTYTLTGDINGSLTVLRSNIVIDGSGYTIANGPSGVSLQNVDNVTLRNLKITMTIDLGFTYGIDTYRATNIRIMEVTITNRTTGILIYQDSSAAISDSIIKHSGYGGAGLFVLYSNASANNLTIADSNLGIMARGGSRLNLTNSLIENNGVGIRTEIPALVNIMGNTFINNGKGLETTQGGALAPRLIIEDNVFINNSMTILKPNNIVNNNTVNGKPVLYIEGLRDQVISGDYGEIIVVNSTNITIENIQAAQRSEVYALFYIASNSTIRNLDLDGSGLLIVGSLNITIANNSIRNSKANSIDIVRPSGIISIENNTIANSGGDAIRLYQSFSRTIINGNSISNSSGFGINMFIVYRETIITNNTFTFDGISYAHKDGNIVDNNTVNGKPLLYLKDPSNITISGDYGQIILVNVSDIVIDSVNISWTDIAIQVLGRNNITIVNSTIADNFNYGIIFGGGDNVTIVNSTITNNYRGMGLNFVRGFTIANSTITNNSLVGISLYRSSNGIIKSNLVSGSSKGLLMYDANNVIITLNTFWSNDWAISPEFFEENLTVFHNNFLNSFIAHVRAPLPRQNTWDAGYPSGGNFWSDLQCVDDFSGPNQDQPGGDGICDSPYIIDQINRDRYPLASMVQNAPLPVLPVVTPVYRFVVTPPASFLTNISGSQVTHTFTLTNTGNVSDTYSLSIISGSGTLSASSISLAPSQSIVFTFTTTAGSPGSVSIAEIKITSQGSGVEAIVKAVTAAVNLTQANSTAVSSGTSPPQRVLPGATVQVVNATKPVRVEVFNLSNVDPTGTPPPPGVVRVGAVLDVSVNSTDFSYIWVNISYAGIDLSGIDESSLKLYRWNSTSASWEPFRETGVDVSRKVVWARAYPDELRGVPVTLGGSPPTAPPALVGGSLEIPEQIDMNMEEENLATTAIALVALASLALAGYVAYIQYRRSR